MKNMKIDANGTEIRVMGDVVNEDAYISLTDIAKYKNPDNAFIVVANWMRNHSTISFLGLWEQIHNPNFKPIEFDRFKAEMCIRDRYSTEKGTPAGTLTRIERQQTNFKRREWWLWKTDLSVPMMWHGN